MTHDRAEDETVVGSKRPGHGLAAYIDSPNVPDKNYRTALTRHIAVTCENASLCQESWIQSDGPGPTWILENCGVDIDG